MIHAYLISFMAFIESPFNKSGWMGPLCCLYV